MIPRVELWTSEERHRRGAAGRARNLPFTADELAKRLGEQRTQDDDAE
jgi:hypothetical protein